MSSLFEGVYDTYDIRMLPNDFDPFDFNLINQLPALRAGLEQRLDFHWQLFLDLLEVYGPFPLKLARTRFNKFSDTAFKWMVDYDDDGLTSNFSRAADQVFEFAPWYRSSGDYAISPDELLAIRPNYTDEDIDYVNEQIEIAHEYRLSRRILENSAPVAWLKANNKEFSYERRYGDPLLIIPDIKVATYLKLTWS